MGEGPRHFVLAARASLTGVAKVISPPLQEEATRGPRVAMGGATPFCGAIACPSRLRRASLGGLVVIAETSRVIKGPIAPGARVGARGARAATGPVGLVATSVAAAPPPVGGAGEGVPTSPFEVGRLILLTRA